MRSFDPHHIPKPPLLFSWPNILGSEPVDLEIGAGQGLHAIQYALKNPQRTLIAIEKTETRFQKLANRLHHHPSLTNVHPVRADAVAFVSHFVPEEALASVFLLYPNPYPKAKQANLRWANRPFMAHLLRKLIPGGKLILATNEASYRDEAIERLTSTWKMELHMRQELHADTWTPRTHFEKKYLERGETCWNLIFCKTALSEVE